MREIITLHDDDDDDDDDNIMILYFCIPSCRGRIETDGPRVFFYQSNVRD